MKYKIKSLNIFYINDTRNFIPLWTFLVFHITVASIYLINFKKKGTQGSKSEVVYTKRAGYLEIVIVWH